MKDEAVPESEGNVQESERDEEASQTLLVTMARTSHNLHEMQGWHLCFFFHSAFVVVFVAQKLKVFFLLMSWHLFFLFPGCLMNISVLPWSPMNHFLDPVILNHGRLAVPKSLGRLAVTWNSSKGIPQHVSMEVQAIYFWMILNTILSIYAQSQTSYQNESVNDICGPSISFLLSSFVDENHDYFLCQQFLQVASQPSPKGIDPSRRSVSPWHLVSSWRKWFLLLEWPAWNMFFKLTTTFCFFYTTSETYISLLTFKVGRLVHPFLIFEPFFRAKFHGPKPNHGQNDQKPPRSWKQTSAKFSPQPPSCWSARSARRRPKAGDLLLGETYVTNILDTIMLQIYYKYYYIQISWMLNWTLNSGLELLEQNCGFAIWRFIASFQT